MTGTFTVLNDRGIHTRPATELVKCATSFKSEIMLNSSTMTANAKSLLGILTLVATRGTRIQVKAKGVDAKEAVEALLHLAKNQFNIQY